MEQWVFGFLTAYNVYVPHSGGDIARGADTEAVLAWVDNYCRANPLRPLLTAVTELIRELGQRDQQPFKRR